jgi:hypothetical protein
MLERLMNGDKEDALDEKQEKPREAGQHTSYAHRKQEKEAKWEAKRATETSAWQALAQAEVDAEKQVQEEAEAVARAKKRTEVQTAARAFATSEQSEIDFWHYYDHWSGSYLGPVTWYDLTKLYRTRYITKQTFVWCTQMGQDVEWIPFQIVWKASRKRKKLQVCFGKELASERVPLILNKYYKTSMFVSDDTSLQFVGEDIRLLAGSRRKLELTCKEIVRIFIFVGDGCELLKMATTCKTFQAALALAMMQVVFVDPPRAVDLNIKDAVPLSHYVSMCVRNYHNIQKISICGAQVKHCGKSRINSPHLCYTHPDLLPFYHKSHVAKRHRN